MGYGSPAQAGIDLDQRSDAVLRKGFPRTGGDRPFVSGKPAPRLEVPPHRRG